MKRFLIERDGQSKIAVLMHPAFWIGLAIKLATMCFFASSIFTQNFAPFVGYFVSHSSFDPYPWALMHGISFPFPALMLYILALPKLVFSFLPLDDIFILRLPVLLADFVIFIILARWLKHKQEHVLWYYWWSPIIFAVCYIVGYLDLIAIGFLFAFLYFFFKRSYISAFVLLGLALASKTGLVMLVPFIAIYLIKERERAVYIFGYLALACLMYVLFNAPYLADPSFWRVISSGGITQLLASNLRINYAGVSVYILPLVYAGLFIRGMLFERLNKRVFLMFLGVALGIVTLLTLPEAGWYCWVIPFFVYFFVQEDRAQKFPFLLLTLSYFGYFLLIPQSPFLEHLSLPYPLLTSSTAVNAAFTLLQGALLLTIIWIYQIGIARQVHQKIFYKPYLVGIAGDSASGKSTLTHLITLLFGIENVLEVAGDDMHKWERHDPHWEATTHLHPHANRLHRDLEHLLNLKRNASVMRSLYDHAVGTFKSATRVSPKRIIVFQGLHALYLSRARESLDLKIFLSPSESLRRSWKISRDEEERGYTAQEALERIEARGPDGEKYIREQQKYADIVISLLDTPEDPSLEILCDNSIDLDILVASLQETALTVTHEHGSDMQRLFVVGTTKQSVLEVIASSLVPEVWEICAQPEFEPGYNGVIQLFLAYTIFYKAKLDHELF